MLARGRLALIPLVLLASTGAPVHAASCPATALSPFAATPGASLTPAELTSRDGVHYAMLRGTVPSFDGLPLSVDITVPCDATAPMPLVSMNHGWTDDKTIWEETGRSDTVGSEFRPGSNAHWNNIWFASRGYAVLTYTARGWHDSCGPNSAGAISGVAPGPACRAFKYWIHTDDQRWEIRDTQWLVGALVQSRFADAERLAITGGSYGGGQTIMNAMLRDRIRCGAVPQTTGVDQCAGRSDGDYAPWKTADGATSLHWTVAIPLYAWWDVIQALAPNGRGSDGDTLPDGDHASPVGVPIQSYLAGIYSAGQPLGNGYYAPPGVDPTADTTTSTLRTLAGNPFLPNDPIVASTISQYRTFKSAQGIQPDGIIPIFWVQGFTDGLFTAFESLHAHSALRSYDPAYPIKLFFGDIGHDYAAERVDEWAAAHDMMNAFLDHYMKGTGVEPTFDVTAAVTRCFNHDDPMELVSARSWPELHAEMRTFSAGGGEWTTTSAGPSRVGILIDPVTQATITQNPLSYRGCRILDASIDDPNAATVGWEPVGSPITMLGGPTIEVHFATTAPDTELAVRLWDDDPASGRRALVTRGVYRSLDGPGDGLVATFQLAPTGYRWAAGHRVVVEVTGNDAPYFQSSNVPAAVVIDSLVLRLPVRS